MAVFHGPRKLAEYESDGSRVAHVCPAPAPACARAGSVPQWLAERPRCGALDLGFVPLSVSGAGLPAWTTRCAPTCSPCRPRFRGGRLFATAPPVCAGVPAAAVGAIWQPRWTPSEVRSRIGNRLLSAADPPAPSGARSAHRPAPPKRTMCYKTGQFYLLPTSAEPAELHRRTAHCHSGCPSIWTPRGVDRSRRACPRVASPCHCGDSDGLHLEGSRFRGAWPSSGSA